LRAVSVSGVINFRLEQVIIMLTGAVGEREISEEEERYIGLAPSSSMLWGRFRAVVLEHSNLDCLRAV